MSPRVAAKRPVPAKVWVCVACGLEVADTGDHGSHCPNRRTGRWPYLRYRSAVQAPCPDWYPGE